LFNKGLPAGEGVGAPSSTPLLGALPPGKPYFVSPPPQNDLLRSHEE
jgi:hypothetical protein